MNRCCGSQNIRRYCCGAWSVPTRKQRSPSPCDGTSSTRRWLPRLVVGLWLLFRFALARSARQSSIATNMITIAATSLIPRIGIGRSSETTSRAKNIIAGRSKMAFDSDQKHSICCVSGRYAVELGKPLVTPKGQRSDCLPWASSLQRHKFCVLAWPPKRSIVDLHRL